MPDIATTLAAILDELRRVRFELVASRYQDMEIMAGLARVEGVAELLLAPDGKLSPQAEAHCRRVAGFHNDNIVSSQHALQHDFAALLTRRPTEHGPHKDAQS